VFDGGDRIQKSSESSLGFNIAFGVLDFDTFKGLEGINRTGVL